MSESIRLSRRSHKKSKGGCRTCKRRHVRCDETKPSCRNCLRLGLACAYTGGDQDASGPIRNPEEQNVGDSNLTQRVNDWVGVRTPSPVQGLPYAIRQVFEDATDEDQRLFFHFVTFQRRLMDAGALQYAVGLLSLPQFLHQAVKHPTARSALLALSAHHLSMITKSADTTLLACSYFRKACGRLREALEEFSEENADAVVAASVMLGWATLEKKHYARLLNGTAQIMGCIQNRGYQTELSCIFGKAQPLPTNDRRLVVMYLSLPETDLQQLKPLAAGLERISQLAKGNPELQKAAEALLTFVRWLPRQAGLDQMQQAEAYHDVRAWTPWMPTAALGLGLQDVLVMVVMSYFHGLNLAAEAYLPDATRATFPQRRTEVIGRVYTSLHIMQSRGVAPTGSPIGLDEALDLVAVPLVYAVRYRLRHPEAF